MPYDFVGSLNNAPARSERGAGDDDDVMTRRMVHGRSGSLSLCRAVRCHPSLVARPRIVRAGRYPTTAQAEIAGVRSACAADLRRRRSLSDMAASAARRLLSS